MSWLRKHAACALLLGAALATASVTGCRDRVRRQYRAAELLLAEDKPALAAAEYDRLVEENPRHPLAVDALFKLGYLYRTRMNDPQRAVQYYRTLAEKYPKSRYADDSLLWMAYLGRSQKDIRLVREAVSRLETDHADNPSSCARGRVQLALALLEAGKPEVEQVCKTILRRYSDQTRQCAQAQLILARAAEKLGKGADAAIKQYEAVVARYPDTTSAIEAKQRIGWIYYGVKRREPTKKPTTKKPPPRRVIAGVPPFAQGGQPGIQMLTLEALRSLLRHRGTETDLNTLMVVSGAAFQFVYDPQNRILGAAVFATNPFETAASSFGYVARQDASSTAEEAMLSLCQTLDRGRPALVPYSKLGWVIVIGYDQGRKQFMYLRPGAAGNRAERFDQFAMRWKQAAEESGGALQPFYQFSLGPRLPQTPQVPDLVRQAAARGASLLYRTSVFGAPGGVAAYEALAADLEAHAVDLPPEDAKDLAAWAAEPLSALRSARRAAAAFFSNNAAALPEPMRSQAQAASGLYRRLDEKLAELQATFPTIAEDIPPAGPQPQYAQAASASAQIVREALELDKSAVEQLQRLATE